MRPRLLLLFVAAALLALLSSTSRAGAGTAACTATATGEHVHTELLKVHLAGTCPASGVSASLPGSGSVVVAVHEVRQFCATNRTCPFGLKTTTDRVAFPAAFTHVTVSSPLWFMTGAGTLLSGREQTTILLRSKRTHRILGRSDFQAVIRID
jgi:hypothetical protein